MNGTFASAVAQIAHGQSLDQWYRPHTHQETAVPEPRTNGAAAPAQTRILAAFKPDIWLKPSEIAEASDVDIANLACHMKQLVERKQLIAQGATSTRRYALAGATVAKAGTKAEHSTSTRKKTGPKSRLTKPRSTRRAPPKAQTEPPPAPACNVADFTPALTADRRLVIVGGSEPLIFSPEQTQNIATLMLDRFEA